MSALVGEKRAGRGEKEGGMESFGWGLGLWRNPDAETRTRPRSREKRPLLKFVKERKPTTRCEAYQTSNPEKLYTMWV